MAGTKAIEAGLDGIAELIKIGKEAYADKKIDWKDARKSLKAIDAIGGMAEHLSELDDEALDLDSQEAEALIAKYATTFGVDSEKARHILSAGFNLFLGGKELFLALRKPAAVA